MEDLAECVFARASACVHMCFSARARVRGASVRLPVCLRLHVSACVCVCVCVCVGAGAHWIHTHATQQLLQCIRELFEHELGRSPHKNC